MGNKEKAALAIANQAIQKAEEAKNMALGLVYVADSYSSLVTILNAAAKQAYTLGATIYVKTTNVPDLWISANNETTAVPYTYTTDDAMIEDLEDNPSGLAIGYYKVNVMEVPKAGVTLLEPYVEGQTYQGNTLYYTTEE